MNDHQYDRSFTDLMAGVAVVFLLIAVIFIRIATEREEAAVREKEAAVGKVDIQKERVTDSLANLRAGLAQLNSRFDGGFLKLGMIDAGVNALEIEFPGLNFGVGQCTPTADERAQLKKGAGGLVEQLCVAVTSIQDAGAYPSIVLEGHTDTAVFKAPSPSCGITQPDATLGFENNVRLSAARAQSVFFELRDGVRDAGSLGTCLDSNFVVSGRGQATLANKNDPKSAENRRLVIRVRGDLRL